MLDIDNLNNFTKYFEYIKYKIKQKADANFKGIKIENNKIKIIFEVPYFCGSASISKYNLTEIINLELYKIKQVM